MDKFETQFENLDVVTGYMGNAMDTTTAASMPEEEVSSLINMVADEHGLALGEEFAAIAPNNPIKDKGIVNTTGTSDLEARFAALSKATQIHPTNTIHSFFYMFIIINQKVS